MSEYDEQADRAPGEHAGEATDGWEAPTTGMSVVDDVLASVQALDGRPVEEHVAAFEQAHERLRRALDPGHG